jgi:iron complex transport system substrate-binding protein
MQGDGESWISTPGLPKKRFRQHGAAQERMVTDSAGRLVAIPVRPQRVITLNASNLGLYVESGGRLVGRGSGDALPVGVKDEIKSVPTVGLPANPDLKQIMAINPDLVIGMAVPEHQALADVLERKGIPVLLQTVTRYSDVLETLRFFGELSGNPELAARKAAAIESRRQELIAKNSGKTSPKVLIVWAIADGLYTALSNSFIGDLVKRLGGVNVSGLLAPVHAKLAYVPLDIKAVAAVQPDVVLFINHQFGPMHSNVSVTLNDPLWRGLDAVRQNRVYQLPSPLFTVNPGAQIETAMIILSDLLYGGDVSICRSS